ncbi:uncharacterized protein LOC129585361 [Paramacrobiotus metropolitanus]|uniref:uncharacterized protein LOC129585361 n=1 Tax=Paramacrobiotus metropolitanus TaxID=2943436 RepID=UPI002445DC39|nr:uncharacterized protein LOC129585361 [Paramacrobiotus metropolitanus]
MQTVWTASFDRTAAATGNSLTFLDDIYINGAPNPHFSAEFLLRQYITGAIPLYRLPPKTMQQIRDDVEQELARQREARDRHNFQKQLENEATIQSYLDAQAAANETNTPRIQEIRRAFQLRRNEAQRLQNAEALKYQQPVSTEDRQQLEAADFLGNIMAPKPIDRDPWDNG